MSNFASPQNPVGTEIIHVLIYFHKNANHKLGCEFRSESLCVALNAFLALPNWAPNSEKLILKMQVKLFVMQTRLGIKA